MSDLLITDDLVYRCAEAAAQTVPGADAVVVASHGRDETAVLAAAIWFYLRDGRPSRPRRRT